MLFARAVFAALCVGAVAASGGRRRPGQLGTTIASLTVYSDSLCKNVVHTVSNPSTSLCYNSTAGDFIVTGNGDSSVYWAATGLYDNSACSGTPTAYSASIANRCESETNGLTRVVRMRGTDLASVYQWGCTTTACGSCANVTVLKEGECGRVNGDNLYTNPVVLGFGTGVFEIQFFKSTDGTCQDPADGAPTMIPDSTCFGPRKVQASSLLRAAGPHHNP